MLDVRATSRLRSRQTALAWLRTTHRGASGLDVQAEARLTDRAASAATSQHIVRDSPGGGGVVSVTGDTCAVENASRRLSQGAPGTGSGETQGCRVTF